MNNQLENNSLDQTIKDNQVTSGVINKELPYIPVEEMFNTPEYDAYIDSADLAVIQEMAQIKPLIDKYGSGAYGNMAVDRPTLASDTYDPVVQQNPLNKDDPEYFNRLMEMPADLLLGEDEPGRGIVAPKYAGIRQEKFQRYYNHPEFNKLGFTPYSDMETTYNANSTVYDDYTRMWGQFSSLAGTGFVSGYRAIGDFFQGDYIAPDLESADEFADAMEIGNSSREGGMAWTNNMLLNSGYTMGIISSIALEEVALAATAGIQGGLNPVSDAMLLTATARNIARLKKVGTSIANSFSVTRMANQTRNMVKTFNNADNARDFWTMQKGVTAGSTLAFFAPETVSAIRNLKTTANGTQNMVNLAKQSTVFGGFYRDARSLNLAVAESKLEGGMVYNDMVREGSNILSRENYGQPVTPEQMINIEDKASRAAFKTTIINAPLIFATNQLVLGNAFGGFNKSFGRMVNDKVSDIGRRIIKTKATKNPFEDAGTGIKGVWNSFVNAGVKGNLKKSASTGLRYFAANFGEGIQEVSQEAVSAGTKDYYTALLTDPLAGGIDLFKENLNSAVSSQFSAQGFDTFMSGFLMGGVVSVPQKIFFQGIPAIYQKVRDPKAYAEHKANRKTYVDSIIKSYNEINELNKNDVGAVFDQKKFQFLIQHQVAGDMTEASMMSSAYDFINEKDYAKFQQIYDVISTGGAQYFEQQMKDFMKLSDLELADAFPSSKKDIKSGKIRTRLQDMVNKISQMEDNYNELKDEFPNPFDESAFDKKTQGREYGEETIRRLGWNHVRYLAMFTRDGFERAVERSNSIFQTLSTEPLFEKMAASDITVLLDKDTIDKEVSFLGVEIETLKNDKSQADLVKEKTEKIKRLLALKAILNDPKNLVKDGSFDRRKIGEFKKEFLEYVKFLSKKTGSFVNRKAVDEALKLIVDHGALKGRAKVYDKTIEALANPEKFNEVFEKSEVTLKAQYKNKEKIFENSINKYLNNVVQNKLLNEISEVEGAFGSPIPEIFDVIKFSLSNDINDLTTFYNEKGEIGTANDPVAFNEINRLKNAYAETLEPTQEEVDASNEKTETVENRKEISDLLENINTEVPIVESQVLTNILEGAYRRYESNQLTLRKKSVKYKEWINTQDGQAYREAFNAIKNIWVSNDKLVLSNDPTRQLTEEQIKNDVGLINWLRSDEGINNDLVGEVLQILKIPLTYISGQSITLPAEKENSEGNNKPGLLKDATGTNIAVRSKKWKDNKDNESLVYQIIDVKTGVEISAEVLEAAGISGINFFNNRQEAKNKWKALELEMPSDGTFVFDNVEGLSYGAKVYHISELDNKGNPKEYIVWSRKNSVVKNGTLTLIPASAATLSSQEKINQKVYINLSVGQFEDSYTLENKDFQLLPENVSRINYREPITPYGGKNLEEDYWTVSKNRYYSILSILTPEDVKTLEFVVEKNPDAGKLKGQYFTPGLDSNPYIVKKVSKYNIGIRTNSSDVQEKIDSLFSSNNSDGKLNAFIKLDNQGVDTKIFAYMPNDNFKFFDGVDPMSLTRQQLNQVIGGIQGLKGKLTKEQILDQIKNNWAKQGLLVSNIDKLMSDTVDGQFRTISQNELSDGLFFNSVLGNVVYDNSTSRNLKELVNEGAADELGNYLIYQLEAGKLERRKIPISNLQESELDALQKRVEQSIGKQELDNLLNGSDAYMAAVLLPDGTYRIVPLKSEVLDSEALNTLFVGLVEQAQETQKENKDGKNPIYNKNFNDEIKNRLFISAHEGLSLSLNVDVYGRIQLTAVKDGKFTDFQLSKEEVNSKWSSINEKIDDLIATANNSDLFKNSISSPQTGSKKGLVLSSKNFRVSYGREVDINELIEKTETNAKTQVAGVSRIEIGADSASIQAKRNSTAGVFQPTTGYGTPVGSPSTTQSTKTLEQIAEESNTAEINRKPTQKSSEVKPFSKVVGKYTFQQKNIKGGTINQTIKNNENGSEVIKATKSDGSVSFFLIGKFEGVPGNMNGLATSQKDIDTVLDQLGVEAKSFLGIGGTTQQISEVEVSPQESSLEKLNQKLDTLKVELVTGKRIKEHRKILKDSKEYQDILKQIKNYGDIANKISPVLTSEDLENIDVFMDWANKNLPDFISVKDIATLGDNMKAGGIRVGAFGLNLNHLAGGLNISGTLYTGASSPFRYHEAFHGVFRMLLTDTEINKYLSVARKEVRAKLRAEGKNFKKELEIFKNSADTYSSMSNARLEQEYYEEYLADQFELFKTGPKNTNTDSSVKSLFTKILEWIKSFFNSYNKNELLSLFENIDAGKYRTSATVLNQFSKGLATGITLEANALIPYKKISDKESKNEGYLFLDSVVADPLVRSIAAMYLSRVSKITQPNTNRGEIFDSVVDDFYELYNPLSDYNVNKSESQKEVLDSITKAIDNYLEPIQDQVYNVLNVIDGQIAEEEYNTEYFEDTVGVRASSQWNTDASLIGGINSTPKQIRSYIATTTMDTTDFFGNKELIDGESLIIPVPFTEVYNGLLKSVKNIADPKKMLQTMYFFGQDNTATGAVVTRILQDIGISEETLLNNSPLPNMQNPLLFQSITKAFENFRVDYLFTQRDINGNILTYSAAQRDDINSQVDNWSQAWNNAYKKIKSNSTTANKVEETLIQLMTLLRNTDSRSSAKVTEDARYYSKKLFDLTGIRLSTQYMKYSILYNRVEAGNVFSETIKNEDGTKTTITQTEQQALVDLHKNNEAEGPLTSKVVREMYSIINNKDNIFSDGDDGIRSRLVTLAVANAPFDETIGLSVFRNSENNLVYSHQKPTFHLKQIEALNNVSELEAKKENLYLEDNHLLNNPAFIEMSNQKRQRVIRVAGTKVGKINLTEEEINENISGLSYKSTYGNFTPQEFALSIINNYTALVNSKSNKVDYVEINDPITNEKLKVALAPSLIRVLESANTGDMMYMTVIRAVEFVKGNSGAVKITDETIDIFVKNINTEYKRIQRESNSETETEEQIVGYNIEGFDEKGKPLPMRAYELHNSALLLTTPVKTELEKIAKRSNSVTLEDAMIEQNMTMNDLRSEVRNKLDLQFEEFKTELVALGIDNQVSIKIKQGLIGAGIKATPALVESNYLLNLNNDLNHNLKQIFLNDWVNTQAINEIFLGDQAVTLKNGVDAIKRAKAQNAAYISAYSAISAPEHGVNHSVDDISLVAIEEPKEASSLTGNNIDVADAQMWMTPKASRYMSFGFGQLTPSIANLYDKIDQGEDITSWQIFGENVKSVTYEDQRYIVKDVKIFDKDNVEVFEENSSARSAILELAKEEKVIKLDGYVNQDNAMLNSKKLVYFDGTTFIKMSAFMLSRQLTSDKITNEDGSISWVAKPNRIELHNLLSKLEAIESLPGKNTLGIAAPLTALKMLKQRVQTLDRINDSNPLNENDYTTLSAMDMGLQSVNPSNKLESIDPTQIKAIVTSEQIDSTPIPGMGLNEKGEVMKVGDVKRLYNKAISRRIEINFKNKRNLIFSFDSAMDELAISKTKGNLTANLTAYLKYAQKGLKASQSSSQLLEFFSTEGGEQKYNLNNPITVNKFEELFLSYLSKGTLAEKQPGVSLTLVSDFGMKVYRRVLSVDSEGIPDRSEIIRENVWNKISNKPDLVEFDTLLGRKIPKEGLVVIDRLRSNLKGYDSKGNFTGLRYTEMLMPAHFKSAMDLVENGTMEMPEVLSKMFAIRIPSQDNHSTINVKHVDFLPAYYGSSAAFAHELVEISGADFDIDKVFAQIKDFYVENGRFIEYGKKTLVTGKYREYLQYVQEKVKKTGSIYNDALKLYIENNQSKRVDNPAGLDFADSMSEDEYAKWANTIIALDMLGLPISKKQYEKYLEDHGEPYQAPLNNEILDYKYALMGNTAVTEDTVGNELPISYQPAALDILKSELKELINLSEVIKGSSQTSEYGNKLKLISERRAMATKSDLKNSQLIKDIRVDKTQPKTLTPNAADNKLAAIMLYGKTYDTLIEEGLPEEANEAKTLAYRILNNLLFDINEIIEFADVMTPEYREALNTNENPVKEFFENDIFEEADKQQTQQTSEVELTSPNIFAKRDAEDSIDINNILGKIKAFKNNKGAAIGAIVTPNVNLSLLTEYGILIEDKSKVIIINGIKYDNFGVLREKLTDGTQGIRKQDIISSLITMATDDAKERLVAKLGLNRSALSLVGNLTSLGMPIRTSLLLVNNPTIQNIYDQALNKKEKTDPGVRTLVGARIKELYLYKDSGQDLITVPVTDALLYAAIENENDLSNSEEVSILQEFLKGVEIQEFTGKMRSVSNLTTGLGRNIAAVNEKKKDIKDLLEPNVLKRNSKDGGYFNVNINPIMDLTKIYKSKTWQSKNIEIFNQVVDQLLPTTFLSASLPFQTILDKTLENINQKDIEFNDDALAAVSRDLLSYVTIKAYHHNQLKAENNSQYVANLNNNFIYPVSQNEASNSIVELINTLKVREDMKDNFFLNSFAQLLAANDQSNQTGMNLAQANTFLSMNQLQKEDLQTSFAQIYGTAATKNDALSIISYIMVKDGLQLKYGSLLDAISPFIINNYLSQIDTANEALRDVSGKKMKSAFGLTFDELQKEFVDGYMQSNVNNALLKTYEVDINLPLDDSIKIDRKNKSLILRRGYNDQQDYIRVRYSDATSSFYLTYVTTGAEIIKGRNGKTITLDNYVETPTYGSNQQWAGGFMFGSRPTYKSNREYVTKKNLDTNEFTTPVENLKDQKITNVERILKDQNANVEATSDGVKVNGKNIADITDQDVKDNAASAAGLMDLLNLPAQPTQQASGVKVVNEVYDKIDDGIYSLNLNYKGKDYSMVIDRDGEITDASYYSPNTLKDVDVKSSFFKFTLEDIKNIFSEIEQPVQQTSEVELNLVTVNENISELKNPNRLKQKFKFGITGFGSVDVIIPINKEQNPNISWIIRTEINKNPGVAAKAYIELNNFLRAKGYKPLRSDNKNISKGALLIWKNLEKQGLAYIVDPTGSGLGKPIYEFKSTQQTIDTINENAASAAGLMDLLNLPAQQISEVETITYTPKGKQKQTYTVKGNKFFNSKGVEVFKENSADRNKLSGNLAVQRGEAQVVEYRDKKYLVNKDNKIMSVTTGKIMQWGEENGDRKAVLQLTQPTQSTSEAQSELSETEESVTELTGQLLFDLKFELQNQNDVLIKYWDKEIQNNTEFKAKLRKQKILSLEDLIDARNKGIYKSDEEFLESLGCL